MESEKIFEMPLTFERSFLPPRGSNIKIVIHTRNSIDKALFEQAVRKVAFKHPLLRARVVMNVDGTAYFTTRDPVFPSTIIYPISAKMDVMQAINDANIDIHGWTHHSPARFILIQTSTGNDSLIIYIHHAVSDGCAVTFVAKHLCQFLANPDLEINELEPTSLVFAAPPDVKIPGILKSMTKMMNKKWAKEKVTFTEEDFINASQKMWEHHRENFDEIALTQQQTTLLVEKCKKVGVSVNAALLAAGVIAKNRAEQLHNLPNHVGFAVDVRQKLTKDVGEACALLASAVLAKVKLNKQNSDSFWDIARKIHAQTQKALASNQKLFLRRISAPLMDPTFGDAMYMRQRGGWEGTPFIKKLTKKSRKFPVGIMVTNLGGLQLPARIDGKFPLELEDGTFYPPIGVPGVIELGISSLMGRIHICLPIIANGFTVETRRKFLETMQQILIVQIQ